MISEWDTNDVISAPKSPEAPMRSNVNVNSFWDRLVQRSAFNEAFYADVASTCLTMGYAMLSHQEGEHFAIRDNMGFETTIDPMDNKFKYERNAIKIGSKDRTLRIIFSASIRDLAMEKANQFGIDVEELTGRILLVGLYAMEQRDLHDKRVTEIKGGKRTLYGLGVKRPQVELVADHIQRLYGSQKFLESPKEDLDGKTK